MGVKYGLSCAHYAKILSSGNFATPVALPGAVSLTLESQADFKTVSAAGVLTPIGIKKAYKSGELEVVSLPLTFLTDIFGYRYENGVLYEGNTESEHFALLCESIDNIVSERFLFYDCLAFLPEFKRETIAENAVVINEKVKIAVYRPLGRLLRGYNADYCASVRRGEKAFDTWFDEVHI